MTLPPSEKTVHDYVKDFEGLSPQELEAKVRSFEGLKEENLPDDMLRQLIAAIRVHRRTTAGPPKSKSKKPEAGSAAALL